VQVYHLALSEEQTEGARVALLPGDPGRVPAIAERFATAQSAREIACKREFRSWLVNLPSFRVLVVSTGIGGPSTSIAVEELALLGVRAFIRVGTCGGIQPYLQVGDAIISTAAVRLDGASTHYAPIEYPAVADPHITQGLCAAADRLGLRYFAGITTSSDTFYPGQERYDSYSGYVLRRFQGSLEEWKRLGVLNYEMETATLFTMCAAMGLKAGAVCGVAALRSRSEQVATNLLRSAEEGAIRVAVEAVSLSGLSWLE
jgi:uridine phosphorylase